MILGAFVLNYTLDIERISTNYKSASSTLLVEQINLTMSSNRRITNKDNEKPKEIIQLLKIVQSLLNVSEQPYKISGISSNPLISNLMRILVVSIISAIFSEFLGHKVTFAKIIKI